MMVEICGKFYAFDVNKISEYVNYSDNNKSVEKEILDSYEGGKNISKTIRELSIPGNQQIDNIKYDLVKTFIIQVLTFDENVRDFDELPFGTKLAINTLIMGGFLVEVIGDAIIEEE